MEKKSDIGLIGLAVMGENIVLNMESRGFRVSVYNRTIEKVDNFINGRAARKNIYGAKNIEELVKSLKRPRKIMLMIKAGKAVDLLIEQIITHLEEGDIIIDGGNSYYKDTNRRTAYLKEKGILYVGTGVSGGEEGALTGPSIMPGGRKEAWENIKPIFQSIAAKVDENPCCEWVGENGAGHFVKMVHNGIEYGDMQLIAEAYWLMQEMLDMSPKEIGQKFAEWNKGDLDSYLIEISSHIMTYDDTDGKPLINKILDTAGQKGTGKWTGITALEAGTPLTLIGEAVFARFLSAQKEERVKASQIIKTDKKIFTGNKEEMCKHIEKALFASKIVSYAQGYVLMQQIAKEYNWHLNYGEIALMWRGGCIIRSAFLQKIKDAFDNNPELKNLLVAPYFNEKIAEAEQSWRIVCSKAIEFGIAIPAMTSAISYFDGYRSAKLPANMLQAQRDYFGAHTYERTDEERGEFFHTNWTGKGGNTISSTYNA